ncbi:MAG TPA: L-rhamnose mutarotase [Spirochaetales bacterium]|nr:L-rhamnose mutarotase [Spirochaetales bacterium]
MIRVGQVIKLKPDAYAQYKKYHEAIWPEVAAMIRECNIRNYSIFCRDNVLFSYFEYVGSDYEADMAKMAADKKTQEWWGVTKPLQEPIASRTKDEWWADMEEVFHQD